MNVSLYQLYLVADRLTKIVAEHGGSTSAVELKVDAKPSSAYSGYWNHHVSFHLRTAGDTAEDREALVAALFERIPGAELIRENGDMTLRGEWSNGVTWYMFGGVGACERVQVGTKTVLRPDPKAPLIEVEEPVFEVRCVDPLAEAVPA